MYDYKFKFIDELFTELDISPDSYSKNLKKDKKLFGRINAIAKNLLTKKRLFAFSLFIDCTNDEKQIAFEYKEVYGRDIKYDSLRASARLSKRKIIEDVKKDEYIMSLKNTIQKN